MAAAAADVQPAGEPQPELLAEPPPPPAGSALAAVRPPARFCRAGHRLRAYNTVAVGRACDGCQAPTKPGVAVMDCWRCNWHLCEACTTPAEQARPGSEEGEECTICFDAIEESASLPCRCRVPYCLRCWDRCLAQSFNSCGQARCPTCRGPVRVDFDAEAMVMCFSKEDADLTFETAGAHKPLAPPA